MADQSFPKSLRILKRRDFLRIGRRGRRTHTRDMVFIVSRRREGSPRIGITVGRQVGKAVIRNRIKRLVREYFRTHKGRFAGGFDLVVIVKQSADIRRMAEVERNFEQFLHKHPFDGWSRSDRQGRHRPDSPV